MKNPGGGASLVTVATCNLNQWALDFDGNMERILRSCLKAKEHGASYRLGPELEICGYGCEDHFLEQDTFAHCWESLAELMERGATDGMLCDFGMPVLFGGVRYNCRVLVRDKKILLIRPKTAMADQGNYRESRYFTSFRGTMGQVEKLVLPGTFREKFQQATATFGIQYMLFGDGTTVGCESCEELWTPRSTHIELALQGVEIIGNGSGSYHELRKLNQRLELIVSATRKCGGVYLYANQRGCDGGRLYYDGGALIACNGRILAQASQFSLEDVEVITATVDLDDVRSYRASIPSIGIQAAISSRGCYVDDSDFCLVRGDYLSTPSIPLESLQVHISEEECCLGPACWLWDYLRRSGAAGFFLPLSGGADSSSVAAIVGAMCQLVTVAAQKDLNGQVAQDCRRVCRQELASWVPATSQELANIILHTAFMGTRNSSTKTTDRAKRLGDTIGSYHLSIPIGLMVEAVLKVFTLTTGMSPRFSSHGGTMTEDLAMQNIQARLRMVTAYLYAQLLPWVRSRSGFLLVLGSANVDEGLRGYMTKYDCSSADLNPIGAISKGDLKKMLIWASLAYGWDVLADVAEAPPTAELRPSTGENGVDEEHSQLDEEDMGMSYYELGLFGSLRKLSRCGPVSM
ncbi:hypothetical protein MPSEU_000480700 [Mayamaea pseudoterrestris]|nr:hypothetical protein MPSEU_000480700 [Mayamaea pseudoterrestris]